MVPELNGCATVLAGRFADVQIIELPPRAEEEAQHLIHCAQFRFQPNEGVLTTPTTKSLEPALIADLHQFVALRALDLHGRLLLDLHFHQVDRRNAARFRTDRRVDGLLG